MPCALGSGGLGGTPKPTRETRAFPGAAPPPPTAPAAPTHLVTTAAASTQINLSWTDGATNESGFQIERAIGDGGFILVTTVAANVTAFSNTGLTASTS